MESEFKVLVTMFKEYTDRQLTYERWITLPFPPSPNIELSLCDCCSSHEIGSIEWKVKERVFWCYISDSLALRPFDQKEHDHMLKNGFELTDNDIF